jgi:rubrerythrin
MKVKSKEELLNDIHCLISSKNYKIKKIEDTRIKWRRSFSDVLRNEHNRNWIGDTEQYFNICRNCGHVFMGYKARVHCKVCTNKSNIS